MATLLDLALKVTLLLIVSGMIVGLMRRASAASRHVALTAALSAAVLLPAARWTLPALPLFVLASEPPPAAAPPPATKVFAPVAAPMAAAEPLIVGPVDQQARSAPGSEFVRASSPSWSWPRVLSVLWLLGTATILARMTVASIRIRKLARDAQVFDDVRMGDRLLEIRKQFEVARPVTLVVSADEWMPLTWGLVRPAILLPSSAAAWIEDNPARLDAVLLHEMAHIARWDAAWHGIARLAVALFWFNPLVWIAARRARLERERACDDAVLARGLRATDYASDLLMLAQTLVLPPRAAGSALAMARQSQLEQRVGALLDPGISRRRASRISRLLAMALIVLMLPMSAAQLAARPRVALEVNGARGLQTPGYDHESALQPIDQVQPTQSVVGASTRRPAPAVTDAAPPISDTLTSVEPQQPSTSLLTQAGKWAMERDAMFRLLIERARNFVKDGRTKIEIGTVALIDMKPLEETLALLEKAAAEPIARHCTTHDPFAKSGGGTCVNGTWTSTPPSPWVGVESPTDAEIAERKARFADAQRNLDRAEVRWDNGLATTAEVAASLRAALWVLTGEAVHTPEQVRFVTRSGANQLISPADHMYTAGNSPSSTTQYRNSAQALYELLTGRVSSISAPPSDADLIEMLKGAAAVKDDVKRADALLELSARYDLTPEMVTLYVAAARGITSATERARVFAQPIRVK